MFITANEIYQRLIEKKITESLGNIQFNFLDISVRIKEKSAIGDLFQEWLANWMNSEDIEYRTSSNTQEFPDFFLHPQSNKKNLLEIKTFDKNSSANFDVANFEAYCRSLKNHAYRLDADYLIFAYSLIDGNFKINQLWLKKVWEITGDSENYPVKCQVKQDVINNIRPITWYSQKARYQPFNSKLDFVESLYETLMQYSKTKELSKNWFQEVRDNYFDHTKNKL